MSLSALSIAAKSIESLCRLHDFDHSPSSWNEFSVYRRPDGRLRAYGRPLVGADLPDEDESK